MGSTLRTRVAKLEALAREVVRHGTWVDETDVCLVHIEDCIYCMARAALSEGEGSEARVAKLEALARAQAELLVCYRVGKRPPERVLNTIAKHRAALSEGE